MVDAGQDDLAVGDGDRVDINVDDAGARGDRLDDFVHVSHGGNARSDIEELPNALGGQPADGPVDEGPVRVGVHFGARNHLLDLVGGLPVDREVVGAAEGIVVHSGGVRHGHVHTLGNPAWTFHGTPLSVLDVPY